MVLFFSAGGHAKFCGKCSYCRVKQQVTVKVSEKVAENKKIPAWR